MLDNSELQKSVLLSSQSISEFLKATAHGIRIQILALLIEKSDSFSFLIENIKTTKGEKISKTALSHHLKQLVDEDLIIKKERGMYELTNKSYIFLKTIIEITQGDISSKTDLISNILSKSYKKNRVRGYPLYQGSWNSFISATSGVLEYLGVPDDYIYLSGRTGVCFITRITEDTFGYVAENILGQQTWQEIYNGINSFGWRVNEWSQQTVTSLGNPNDPDPRTAREMFEKIKEIIDREDKPVVLWGVPIPNFGIVYGYEEEEYLVSSYRRKEGRKEVLIPYNSLSQNISWTGGEYRFLYFTKNDEYISIPEEEKKAINRAIQMIKGIDILPETKIHGFTHIVGLNAYDEWSNHLLNVPKLSKVHVGYYGRYFHDAKSIAMEYLERIGRKYTELNLPQGEPLLSASMNYRLIKNIFEEYLILFPYFREFIKQKKESEDWDHKSKFTKNEDIPQTKRKKGSEFILKIKSLEQKALSDLETAFELWKNE